MLNILNLKKIDNLSKISNLENEKKYNYKYKTRHYPPANKEWFNSIYAYNKNTSKSLPVADKVILKLIKSFLNLYSRKLEKKTKTLRLNTRRRRLSTNRILTSRAELKHTSDKVLITIYLYNRNKIYYLNKIKKINKNIYLSFIQKMKNVKNMANLIISDILKQKKILVKTISVKNKNNKFENYIYNYETQYLKNFVFKSLNKEVLFLLNRQMVYFNESKLKKTSLLPFFYLIKNVYNKKVDLNLVNLKYFYLNSHIFTETIVTKLKQKKNRLLRVLKASLRKFKLPIKNKLTIFNDIYNRKQEKQNIKLNNLVNYSILNKNLINKDMLQEVLQKVFKENFVISKLEKKVSKNIHTISVTKTILNLIKYKSINGIRIEAAGRLTRRNTAARSVFKIRYKGNIKDIDSSSKGLPSIILRGNAKPNVQYTKLKSNLKIGSFGIKGWVSSN